MATVSRWSLQDAKAQFSEVVRRALADGPQVVSRSGEDAVVIVSNADYHRLRGQHGQTLGKLLAKSPLRDVTLDVKRSRDTGRAVKL
ncbi:MAG TPA: type II toxin-antitoxin system Phd/YefM family antitoxin [Gemmatimonadaceae bacterium]|nr:type II toxin-antitoxin system Phd/YefM family antitoxin [Gemmatimonadaceae bacterium]